MGEREITLKRSLEDGYLPTRGREVRGLKWLVEGNFTGVLYSSSFVAIFQQVNLFSYRYVPIFMYTSIHN